MIINLMDSLARVLRVQASRDAGTAVRQRGSERVEDNEN